MSSFDLDIKFPLKGNSNNFLFEVKVKNFNTTLLKFHYFEGMREAFKSIDVPLH